MSFFTSLHFGQRSLSMNRMSEGYTQSPAKSTFKSFKKFGKTPIDNDRAKEILLKAFNRKNSEIQVQN